jgi:hypothetical protein
MTMTISRRQLISRGLLAGIDFYRAFYLRSLALGLWPLNSFVS